MALVSIPSNPVPEGAVDGTIKTPDGVELRFARWPAGDGKRKGTVCVFPGRAEMIEKYFEVVSELRARGFAVAVLDWRGQGGSTRMLADPRKGHVEDFAEYQIDLDAFMKQIVLPD
jgi:lysophospholipase